MAEGKNLSKRIAIIGAGASGLTAAHHLKKLGYQDVTLFEREDRVGGKIHSYNVEGFNHELGQLWVGENYKTVLEMAREFGIEYQSDDLYFDAIGENGEHFDYEQLIWKRYSKLTILRSLINYWRIGHILRTVTTGGYHSAHPDLFLPFSQFAKKYGIEPLAAAFLPFWMGCGYGPFDEVPALYVAHLFKSVIDGSIEGLWKRIIGRHASKRPGIHPRGHQYLWNKIATSLNVKLESPVDKIMRSNGSGVVLESKGKTYHYDAVIVSLMPSMLLETMDATEEEKNLFSRVEDYSYYVTIFKGEGPSTSQNRYFLYIDNIKSEKFGSPLIILNRKEFSGIWVSYQLAREGSDSSDLLAALKNDLPRVGINFKETIIQKKWNYFPHVKTADLQEGFYQRLHGLQGKNNTYYIGGLMNFEAVEYTASFAKELINNHFG